jgi:CheY-like chemotaxis protein/anti-sigma regulatory factor (Ser/Thr protein kinase)
MARILVAEDDRATCAFISETLRAAKFAVVTAPSTQAALKKIKETKFDVVLLDIWMPQMNGLDLLASLRKRKTRPKVIVITSDSADSTSAKLLEAIRDQAYQCISTPIVAKDLVSIVKEALEEETCGLPIEVISARSDWIELLVPCTLETARRIEGFMTHLEAGLSEEVRGAVGLAFHELLLNAIEWGGKLNPRRKVRISYLRAKRMVLYRIADPGPGFKFEDLDHAANAEDPMAHDHIRVNKGLRPGGFGLMVAKAKVDELIYNEAHNEVVFVKYLDS